MLEYWEAVRASAMYQFSVFRYIPYPYLFCVLQEGDGTEIPNIGWEGGVPPDPEKKKSDHCPNWGDFYFLSSCLSILP